MEKVKGKSNPFLNSIPVAFDCLSFFYRAEEMILTKPFNTANLKLKKPIDNLEERDKYEKLCRY
jgi:hypothetical protein